MSHRRKSARPTNKLRRQTDDPSVSSDSDADHNKMLVEEHALVPEVSGESVPASPTPQLVMPPDLWQDFQALRAATNLDTASLMRRLIQDYGRAAQSTDDSQLSPCEEGPGTSLGNASEETPMEYQTLSASAHPQDEEFVILDLSSGSKATQESMTTDKRLHGNESFEEPSSDAPLDLTCRDRRMPHAGAKDVGREPRAPDAHRAQSDQPRTSSEMTTFLFTAAPNLSFVPAGLESGQPQPRAAHGARPESAHSPVYKPTQSLHQERAHNSNQQVKLANHRPSLSGHNSPVIPDDTAHILRASRSPHSIPLRASSHAAHPPTPQGLDVSKSIGGTMHGDLSKVMGLLQGDVNKSISVLHGELGKNVSVLHGDISKSVGVVHGERVQQEQQQQCVSFPVLSSSCPSILRHHLDSTADASAGAPASMQLPTVTSLEFQADVPKDSSQSPSERAIPGVYSVHMKLPNSSETTVISLPSATSTSALFLDAASGGLVSAVNIPLMTTANGGQLVAIPVLHALPEALAAAGQGAGTATQQPGSVQSPVHASPMTRSSLPSSVTASSSANATSTVSTPKPTKPKLGRPRGQGKAQKAQPKDMKLVTENTLFPGVYTSILKLPWSKRARGKKAKSAAAPAPVSSADAAAACAASVDCVKIYSETEAQTSRTVTQPSEAAKGMEHENLLPGHAGAHSGFSIQSAHVQDADPVPANFLSVPVVCQTSQPAATSAPLHVSNSVAESTQSVMMVYPSGTVSTLGKPVRRRGRPPKLPMLSHLLSGEKTPRTEDTMYVDEEKIEVTSHPHSVFVSSASQHFPPSSVVTTSSSHPEPMEIQGTDGKKVIRGVGDCGGSVMVGGGGGEDGGGGGGSDKLEGTSLETRFNILANQLGLEICSTYHTDIVQNTSSERQAKDAALYQEMLMSSRALVEVKPRRRQLNDLIKPSDDCVYTSFRITPRNGGPGRRGGKTVSRALARKRAAQLERERAEREAGGAREVEMTQQSSGDYDIKSALYDVKGAVYDVKSAMLEGKDFKSALFDLKDMKSAFDVKRGSIVDKRQDFTTGDGGQALGSLLPGEGVQGSAVITERIPGGGEVSLGRLYQDLYYCKLCNEMLPADDTVEHRCGAGLSPMLRACDSCGVMGALQDYRNNSARDSGQSETLLCERCMSRSPHDPLGSTTDQARPFTGELGSLLSRGDLAEGSSSPAHPKPSQESSLNSADQTQNTPDAFACLPCGVRFMAIADYIEHRRSAHLDKMSRQPRKTHTLKTQVCPAQACPRLFHTQAELARHVREEHNDLSETERNQILGVPAVKQEPVEEETGSGSVTAENVNVNVTDPYHESEDLPNADESRQQYTCTQDGCTKTFLEPIDLLEHVQASHENVREWPCPMNGCTRVFSAERHLRVHLLVHKEEKPLKCKFCNYRCRQKNALNWHMRKHPESTSHYRKFAGLSADV